MTRTWTLSGVAGAEVRDVGAQRGGVDGVERVHGGLLPRGATGHPRIGGRRRVAVRGQVGRRVPLWQGRAPADGQQRPVCHSRSVRRQIDRPRRPGRPAQVGEERAVVLVERVRVERVEQVGPAGGGAAQRLVAPPAGDRAVVAATAAPRAPRSPRQARRLGVDGALEQAHRAVATSSPSDSALPSTPGSSRATASTIDQDGDLAAGQHVVADARPRRPASAAPRSSTTRAVDALVAAAGEDQPGLARPARAASAWVNGAPAGRRDDQRGRAARRPAATDVVERLAPRLGLHDHAGAAAVRACRRRCGAGRRSSRAGRARARSSRPRSRGLAEQRDVAAARGTREDRDDVDAHAGSSSGRRLSAASSSRPGGGSTTTAAAVEVDLGHDRRDERDQHLAAVRRARRRAGPAPAGAAPR